MVVVANLTENNKMHYEIDQVDNFNDFLYWLHDYEGEEEFSMTFGDHVYHFRTHEERIQFAFGFSAAWNVIDDKYLEESNRREPCPSDCVVNGLSLGQSVTEHLFLKT